MSARVLKFAAVGVAGFIVQLAALAALSALLHVHWVWATILAVECAIVHNFCWHVRWTWQDRTGAPWLLRLAKFHAGTAATSVGGNLAVMSVLVTFGGIDPVPANAVAVALVCAVNFLLAERWVFRHHGTVAVALLLLASPAAASAAPPPAALDAWRGFVARAEAAVDLRESTRAAPADIAADGESIGVEGGTVSRWRGTVLVRGITLDALLHRLQHPGTPPPQEDVVAARVLGRTPESLQVYMRLVRRAIVTVTYDTEHEMCFRRLSPTTAVARSVATRIEEVGGGDKGFLWRLNSYWRYDQRPDGVIVSVETLSLSRDVPLLIRPIAGPVVHRVARESMVRTLAALREYMEKGGAAAGS